MAKFNEYTQKATPEDADTLMIYDAAAKANKLSPFSGIWNWIVGKLTNAVISNLQTNNKTVLGALNELNSKSFKKLSNKYNVSNGITENAGPHPIMSEKYTVIAAYNSYTSYIIIPFIASSDKTWRCYVMQTNLKPVDNLDDYEITFLVVPSE